MADRLIEPVDIAGVLRIAHPVGAPRPFVFDSPHSGTSLPPDFAPAVPVELVLASADTHVEALFAHVSEAGATLLTALFPRSFLDVNRGLEDMDPELVAGRWPGPLRDSPAARRGMGLIWRYAWGGTPMYAQKLDRREVEARIERYWRPYHATLKALLDKAHARFGTVWHVNCHSMPAMGHKLSPDPEGTIRPDFVLGDRHGTSCASGFTEHAATVLRGLGYTVALNDPFAGAELVRAYADPARGRHSLQIEINRSLYMDEATRERLPGFTALERDLRTLTSELLAYVEGLEAAG